MVDTIYYIFIIKLFIFDNAWMISGLKCLRRNQRLLANPEKRRIESKETGEGRPKILRWQS